VIITGGKKVDPLEVEAVLRASGVFEDVAVLGVTDLEWGQRIVALYPKPITELDPLKMDKHLLTLASFKRPKQYILIEDWPRNAQGKLNRAELGKRIASA
jgi:O-succinylbenzoic acid--CoA ligase